MVITSSLFATLCRTKAFFGLQAREIHVCGGLEASDLVRSLCVSTQDDFELRTYERMSPVV